MQFSLAGILCATFWLAVWLAAWRIEHTWHEQGPLYVLTMSFRFSPVTTAVGALLGRAPVGAFIGIGTYLTAVAGLLARLSMQPSGGY